MAHKQTRLRDLCDILCSIQGTYQIACIDDLGTISVLNQDYIIVLWKDTPYRVGVYKTLLNYNGTPYYVDYPNVETTWFFHVTQRKLIRILKHYGFKVDYEVLNSLRFYTHI